MSTQETEPDSQEYTLPVKREDAATVEERLSDSVLDEILPSRYYEKDEDGNVIETAEELFERIAKNVALAEVVYEAEKHGVTVTVTPDQVKDNHSRRGELAGEVFGFDNRSYSNLDEIPAAIDEARDALLSDEEELTEHNVSKFSYDNVVPELENGDIREHVEAVKNDFEQKIAGLELMPNSPTIMNAGSELQQLSACFVISPDDDMTDIHSTLKEAAEVFQTGGGMGYGFWRLRPQGDPVGSTGGIASGPITFMRTYDQMCKTIAQGGVRRGAQMGVMRIDHPDVIEFIHAKNTDVSLAHTLQLNDPDDFTHQSFAGALEEARELIDDDGNVPEHLRNAAEGHLSNFNISVGVTDEFMEAYENGEMFTLKNPQTGEPHIATPGTEELYELYDLGEYIEVGEPVKLPAEELYNRVVDGNHENGEPGMLFIERANKEHSFPVESTPTAEHSKHEILASNPCGEQFLEEYEACNLLHINLSTLAAKDQEATEINSTFTKASGQPPEDIRTRDFREFYSEMQDNGFEGAQDDPELVASFLNQAIDWDKFDKRIKTGTRFLENVCTMSEFPVDKIEETVRKNRKVGLGIMGLAQLFIQLGVKYDSDVAVEMTEQLMTYINRRSKEVSHNLAVEQERGSFETHDESKYADPTEYPDYFEQHTGRDPEEWEDGFPIRNHNTTTIAPTGTTSIIGKTSGGCEPIFSVINLRTSSDDIEDGEQYTEIDNYFELMLEANGINVDEVAKEGVEQMRDEDKHFTGIEGLSKVPDKLAELFVTTQELAPKEHVDIQAAAQKGVDSSISKTINAPFDVSKEESRDIFKYAYDQGVKGITYYRSGSRNTEVKSIGENQGYADGDLTSEEVLDLITENFGSITEFTNDETVQAEIEEEVTEITDLIDIDALSGGFTTARPRNKTLYGPTVRMKTGYGKVHININEDEQGNPFEVFCEMGSSGGTYSAFAEALGKVISMSLRSGVDPSEIIGTLKGIRMPKIGYDQGEQINSIPEAIAIALERYLDDDLGGSEQQQKLGQVNHNEAATNGTAEETRTDGQGGTETATSQPADPDGQPNPKVGQDATEELLARGESPECPDCGAMKLEISEGCKTCRGCGWSQC